MEARRSQGSRISWFEYIDDFRKFRFSFWVLEVFEVFEQWCSGTTVYTAFELIRDSRDPSSDFPWPLELAKEKYPYTTQALTLRNDRHRNLEVYVDCDCEVNCHDAANSHSMSLPTKAISHTHENWLSFSSFAWPSPLTDLIQSQDPLKRSSHPNYHHSGVFGSQASTGEPIVYTWCYLARWTSGLVRGPVK